MAFHIILASGSQIRAELLRRANVPIDVIKPRIDEDSIKAALIAESAGPRDVADCLAEMKARKISDSHPDTLVLGCDQVLDFRKSLLSKPKDQQDCIGQLAELRGHTHQLCSAAVICENGQPIWRHVGVARLRMRDLSDDYIQSYVSRNWDSIRHSVGGYKLEEEGVRLFSSVQGDFFHVLGLPLLEILSYLALRGDLET